MFVENRLSGSGWLAGKVLLFLVAVFMIFTPAVFAENVVIDFSNTVGYGMDADTVMIEGIQVDSEVTNPFDPTHPTIITSFYNVPFVFDYATLHLVPDLDGGVVVDDDSSCANLQVTVSSAFTGDPISGASVTVGSATQTTNASGIASFTNLVSGSAQISATASGYDGADRQLTLVCDADNSVGLALNPEEGEEGSLQAGEARVVLTWGQNPSDLDSHLTGPDASSNGSLTDTVNRFHIYYSHKTEDVAALDVDDVTSFGPETVTITPPAGSSTLRPGLYRYSVHHYSGTSDISNSSASVTLYLDDREYEFLPPAGSFGDDCVWTVFELAVNPSGAVTVYTINTYTDDLSPSAITRTGYGSVETGVDFSRLPQK